MIDEVDLFWAETDSDYGRNAVRCEYCGEQPCEWVDTPNGRRLRDLKGIHSCKEYRQAKMQERAVEDK